jgi:hypothetical protein
MRIRKLVAYIQVGNERKGERRMFLPSGYRGAYIVVEEDSAYNLGVAYLSLEWSKKFLDAKKKIDK